ncbi:type VII toxin-antitoxin system MntA family adenylyltransferase antitoxin [Desulfocucumis palustris]|nr:nucleotidyltransferase domain-containing protein [Desulfocucumis palustris]
MYRFEKIKNGVLKLIPRVIEILGQDKDIISVYLFGSYAEDRAGDSSDVDLAVLLSRDYPAALYFEKKLTLLARVTTCLKTDEVDLIILNQAPPSLAYRVFCKGKLLWERSGQKSWRVNFQAQTYDRYFDFLPVEKILHEGLIRRIKEGRFGG